MNWFSVLAAILVITVTIVAVVFIAEENIETTVGSLEVQEIMPTRSDAKGCFTPREELTFEEEIPYCN